MIHTGVNREEVIHEIRTEEMVFDSPSHTNPLAIGDSATIHEQEIYSAHSLEDQNKSMMGSWILGILVLLCGLLMQSMAHKNQGPLLLSIPVFFLGFLPLLLPFMADRWSRRAYVLTFGMVAFIGGSYQLYQIGIMGEYLFSDENLFYSWSRMGIDGTFDWSNEEYWIPVKIWRSFYSLSAWLGTGDGSWVGTVPNALVVAWSAAILSRTARHIFGPDDMRLRRLGTFFAFSGLFWMYGVCFLRDSYALILQIIMVWALVRCLCSTNMKNILIATLAIGLCWVIMEGVRGRTLPMFMAFILLAIFAAFRRKGSAGSTVILMMAGGVVLLIAANFILSYFGSATEDILGSAQGRGYGQDVGGDSLTRKLVMGQVLPIRIITGSVLLLVYPIPLWTHFFMGQPGYVWLKGLQGCLMIFIVIPLFLTGLRRCFTFSVKGGRKGPIAFFLMGYTLFTLMAVAASAIDTRYMGQFLPVILLVAIVPDWRNAATRSRIVLTGLTWYVFVLLGHAFWFVLKFI